MPVSLIPDARQIQRLSNLQHHYRTAKAAHEAALEIGRQAQAAVLAAKDYRSTWTGTEHDPAHRGERITEIINSCDMSDTDFERYVQQVHAARVEMGLSIPSAEYSCDYATRPALRAAEDALIDWAIETAPAEYRDALAKGRTHHRHRATLLDLATRVAII